MSKQVYKQPWLSKIELPTAAPPKEVFFDESEQDQTTESAEEADSDEATEFEMIEDDEDMKDDTEEATKFEMIEDIWRTDALLHPVMPCYLHSPWPVIHSVILLPTGGFRDTFRLADHSPGQ